MRTISVAYALRLQSYKVTRKNEYNVYVVVNIKTFTIFVNERRYYYGNYKGKTVQ